MHLGVGLVGIRDRQRASWHPSAPRPQAMEVERSLQGLGTVGRRATRATIESSLWVGGPRAFTGAWGMARPFRGGSTCPD